MGTWYHTWLNPPSFLEDVPLTPSSSDDIDMKLLDAPVRMLLEQTAKLGFIVAYKQEQGGRLIQHVFPKKEHEVEQISGSSKAQLALHTEAAFHPYRPDYVVLFCLRGDPSAGTTYANANDIVMQLEPSVIETLLKPKFVTSVDKSFRTNGEQDQQVTMPVLSKKDNGGYTITYDEDLMTGTEPAANDALMHLKEAIEKSTREVVLKKGDILIIDNNRSVHGRRPFTPRYDGTDRWLLRVLVRKELPPDSDCQFGVITTEKFGDNR